MTSDVSYKFILFIDVLVYGFRFMFHLSMRKGDWRMVPTLLNQGNCSQDVFSWDVWWTKNYMTS